MENRGYRYSVLVVDDDEDTRYGIRKILEKYGCCIKEADTVEQALSLLTQSHFDIVFSDMRFHGDLDGGALLETVRQQYPDVEVVIMSCSMDAERKTRLMNKGASRCLEKPFYKDVCAETLAAIEHKFNRKAA